MLHCSECAQTNSSILLFSCRENLKFSHCGQSVVCKMCKIILYSALHFCIMLRHNIFPVIIIYCILKHTGIQTCLYLEICKGLNMYRFSNTKENYNSYCYRFFSTFPVSPWVPIKIYCDWMGDREGERGKNELPSLPCRK